MARRRRGACGNRRGDRPAQPARDRAFRRRRGSGDDAAPRPLGDRHRGSHRRRRMVGRQPGSATLEWRGWRVDSSVAVLIGAVAAVAVAAAIFYRGAWTLWGVPRRILFWRRMARREKGYRTLTRGLVAVAAGEAEEARKLAARAEKLLGDPPLTKLLTAQAAQLIGDEAAARTHFADMLDGRRRRSSDCAAWSWRPGRRATRRRLSNTRSAPTRSGRRHRGPRSPCSTFRSGGTSGARR